MSKKGKEEETIYSRVAKERKDGKKPNTIGFYDVEKSIGEGNFAKVKLATHALTGAKVAIKIVDKTKISKAAAEKLVREVRILKTLNHPHICRLYEVIDSAQEVFLIMEYAEGGELFDYLVAHGRMKERDARRQFRQIVSAIHYCHQQHVIHRDLKAENLLLDADLNAKIADFGFSNNFEEGKQLNTWCGSPPYAAPELFQGKEYFGPEIDVWSLGVVLYVLVCGALPFDGSTLTALRARVLSGKFKVPFYMSTDCEQLIKKMLVVESSQRITLDGVLKDKWFNEGHEPLGDPQDAKITISNEQHQLIVARLEEIGISREKTEKALKEEGFDQIWATYHLVADQLFERKAVGSKESSSGDARASIASITETPSTSSSAASAPKTNESSPQGSQEEKPATSEQPETKKKARRHTVNAQMDVDQIRKEMSKKPPAPVASPSTFATPASPPALPETKPALPGEIPEPNNFPIPRNTKDRRQRALSLSTTQRPASVYTSRPSEDASLVASASGVVGTSTPGTATPVVSSPLNPNSTGAKAAARPEKLQSSHRRISFKEKFMKTLGFKDLEPNSMEPRTLRFHFSVSTTSAKDPREIIVEIERVLTIFQVAFERDKFLFLCRKNDIAFEIEICKLPRLSMNGLRFKRLAGDQWGYKDQCQEMISQMRL